MKQVKFIQWVLVKALVLTLISESTWASDTEKALARAQQMLRQMSAREAQLNQEIAQLKKEYNDFRAESEKALAKVRKEKNSMSKSILSLKQNGKSLDKELDQTQMKLEKTQSHVKFLQENLTLQSENLSVCKKSNEALADTAFDMINLYRDKGFYEILVKKEPVTGLAKVKVENIVQDFEDQVLQHQLIENPQSIKPVDQWDTSVAGGQVQD